MLGVSGDGKNVSKRVFNTSTDVLKPIEAFDDSLQSIAAFEPEDKSSTVL